MQFKLFVVVLFLVHGTLCHEDYYWRDYQPMPSYSVPLDAVVAGKDINQGNVYIGQASIWPHAGFHTASISPARDVWSPYGGPKQAKNGIQILCSNKPENFKWLPATSTNLHLVGINTHVVTGGVDQDSKTYIGRVKHQGDVVVGKVYTHNPANCEMVFIHNNRELRVTSYEILTYNESDSIEPTQGHIGCYE